MATKSYADAYDEKKNTISLRALAVDCSEVLSGMDIVSENKTTEQCQSDNGDDILHVDDPTEEAGKTIETQPSHTKVCSYGGDACQCPVCELNHHISYLFSNQRRSSEHVLASWPSPLHPQFRESLPLLPAIERSNLKVCPVYKTYGFCFYSYACYLPHPTIWSAKALVQKADSAEEEFRLLVRKAQIQLDEPLWRCDICGYLKIDENCVAAVGETYFYRCCPMCSFFCYLPYITYLIEHVCESVGDDYQRFKDIIEDYRIRLPDEYKVPLSFEAHRVASVLFSWSLVSPTQARDAVEAAYKANPKMEAIISVGSGSGYVEHIFNRVMNAGVDVFPFDGNDFQYPLKPNQFSTNSFIGVHTSFYGKKRIAIYAFDEIPLRRTYSVHVSLGGPLSILSMNCEKTVLLLCWPPVGSPKDEQSSMAFEALEYFIQRAGKVVIYIGDVASTGDWRFHQLLHTHYKLVRDYPVRREVRRWVPQEMGLVYAGNDTIGVYQSRITPLFMQ